MPGRSPPAAAEALELEAAWIVNAAGLHAQSIAQRMHGFPQAAVPPLHLAKGHYFSLRGRSPFTRLIYPTPTTAAWACT